MFTARGHVRLCTVLALLLGSALFLHAEPPLPPKPDKYFNDYANVVPPAAGAQLNAKLEQFERDTTNQVLVAVFPKIPEGTYLEDFTVKTAQAWGTGQKKLDNGLILFVFVADRKMRIEVGYGLEGVVPDSIAASIIRDVIRPQFKTGNYAAGIDQGIDAIFKATRNEYKGTGQTVADGLNGPEQSRSGGRGGLIVLVIAVVFFIWCQLGDSFLQRGGRAFLWGLLDVLRFVLISGLLNGGSGGRGGSSGGSSSGGGYSGGGGSFGGGGASGDW